MSIFDRFKRQQMTSNVKRQLIEDFRKEAYEAELKKIEEEKKLAAVNKTLREIEAAKKAGAEKARVGGTSYNISDVLHKAATVRKGIETKKAALDKEYKAAKKELDEIRGIKTTPKKKKTPAKKKPVSKKKPATKKKKPASTKKRPKKPLTDVERERRALLAEGRAIARKRSGSKKKTAKKKDEGW